MRTVFKFDREEDAAVENRTTYRTRAQDELLAYLSAEPGKHFTAAEIRDHFAKQEKPIGTATIYRQLERFVAEGKIRKYILGPGKAPAIPTRATSSAGPTSTANANPAAS